MPFNRVACFASAIVLTCASIVPAADPVPRIAWFGTVTGQFVYGRTTDSLDLKPIIGKKYESRVMVVKPDDFGLTGKVIDRFSADTKTEEFQKRLLAVARSFDRQPMSHSQHVQSGIALGIEWKTKLPESDAQSVRAKVRARGR